MLGERSVDDLFVVALASAVLILMPLLQRHLNKPTALTSHVEPPEPKTGKRSTEESQFHSHQIFHMLVVAGAVVHLHGISQLQEFRSSPEGGCNADAVL
ncbi:PAQR1 protein, partial [Polypterus senegalus]